MEQGVNWTDVVTAVASGVQALAVIGALIYAGIQVRQATHARESQARDAAEALETSLRPYVTAYLDTPQSIHVMQLIIKNTGRTAAYDVSFTIDPPLEGSVGHPDELVPLHQGISMIAPGQTIACDFEYLIGREQTLPLSWDVEVRYSSSSGSSYKEDQHLDFRHMWGTVHMERKNMHDLVKEIDKLAKVVGRWSTGDALRVTSHEAESQRRQARIEDRREGRSKGEAAGRHGPDQAPLTPQD